MDLLFEIVLSLIYIFLFILLIRRLSFFKLEGINKNGLPLLLILKVLLGTMLALLYTYYYPDRLKADVFKYFDDSKVMYDSLWSKPADFFRMLFGIGNDSPYFDSYYAQMNNWYRQYETNIYNDSHIIIRFNAVVRLFSFGYFTVHTVFMSMIALIGQVALFKFFSQHTKLHRYAIFVVLFLLPSVLFWSSGVLKEGLLFLGMGFLLWYSFLLYKRFSFISLILVIFSVVLLAYLKFYILAALLPLLITHYWCLKTNNRFIWLKYAFTVLLMLLAFFNFHHVFPNYNLVQIMVNKQNDFIYLALDQDSGSLFTLEKLKPGFLFIMTHAPKAFLSILFLPHIFMAQPLLSWLPAIENAFLLILFLILITHFNTKGKTSSFFIMSLLFSVITLTLLGLTTPVLGAAVRYKVPVMSFLCITLLMLIDLTKLRRSIDKTRKILKK